MDNRHTQRRYAIDSMIAVMSVAIAAGIGTLLEPHFGTVDIVMVFLLAIIIVAFRASLIAALLAIGLAVASFNFLFVSPRFTFSVNDGRYLVTFGVMTLVGMAVATLNARVRMQAAQLAKLKLQQETEQLRAALLSSVSHDLRTPLGTILGAATTLLDEQTKLPKDRRVELLRAIETQADHLSRLLRNLLEMTRLDRDPKTRPLEPHAIEEIVETAIRGLSPKMQDRIAPIKAPTVPVFANIDSVAVEIVLLNLLENAGKYSPDGEPIEISFDTEGDVVTIEVLDRGSGVIEADRELIFDKFSRGNHPGVPGAGLGLAIARVIIEAHGGKLYHRPRDSGPGSAFGFTLPKAETATLVEESHDD